MLIISMRILLGAGWNLPSLSTCAIIGIDEQLPKIHVSYIGDSGYYLYSFNEKKLNFVHQSPEQTHDFNFPFQIGTGGDPPSSSIELSHEISNNDIIVLGTDGLTDNLDAHQIKEVLNKNLDENYHLDSEKAVQEITKLAYDLSLQRTYLSPFAKRALMSHRPFIGGKSDDISVIVAQIKLAKPSAKL